MKSKFLSSAILAPVALATTLSFVACGGEDSPNTPPAEEVCNDPANPECNGNVPTSSAANQGVNPTSSESVGGSSASAPVQSGDGCVATPVTFPEEKFIDIGEVYKSIQCNEKVVFIVRHAERDLNKTTSSAPLLMDGYEASVLAGTKIAGTEPFKYIYSGMLRTYQTAAGIATGRGDAACTADYDEDDQVVVTCPQFEADSLPQLKDGWYTKDKTIRDAYIKADTTGYLKNSNVMLTDWVYEGNYADAFYDLDERSKEFLALIVKDYSEMPKYTLAASHDQVLMPLTAWATHKKVDLKLHDPASRNWLNYIAGVAIIINDKNEQRYVAVKGMNDNVQPDGTVIDGGVQ